MEENQNKDQQNQEQAQAQTQQEAPKETETKQEHMIPKTRFDEINSKYREVQAKLDELLAEKQTAERTAKEEQGRYQELYTSANEELTKAKTEQKAATERAAQLEQVITGLLESKLEAVPEQFRDLVPSNLSPEAKLDWLNAAEAKGLFGTKDARREEPIGKSTNPGSTQQTVDLNKLSPTAMMRAAYGAK